MIDISPKITICLPVLNARKFLPQRWESIRNQSLPDWELIVSDGGSDDGSWEFLKTIAETDPRVRLYRTISKGIYAGINDCITKACGEYISIATADDTMEFDFLEKLSSALDENPDCGICQCRLEIINETGDSVPDEFQWQHYTLGKYNPDLINRKNKRLAPHDGLLYPGLLTIYTSLNQLLIRKGVFDRCGLFDGKWGAISDFEWGMRIGLLENCIYIPDRLASWRLHAGQATDHGDSYERREKILEMVYAAIEKAMRISNGAVPWSLAKPSGHLLERDLIQLRIQQWRSGQCMLSGLLHEVCRRPVAFLGYLKDELLNKSWGQWHHGNRYRMIGRLLKLGRVPAPIILDHSS